MERKYQLSKIRGKEGQIGATLTWFVAFLIIFFITILFIASTIILSSKKKISIENIEHNSEALEAQRALISFLNTPIKIDSAQGEMKDLISSSIDPYIDDETGIYFASFKISDKSIMKKLDGDINNLDAIRPQISKEFFIKNQAELKDDLVLTASKSVLDEFCEEYMLKVPQGIIKKGEKGFLPESDFETSNWKETFLKEWSGWYEIKIPHRNQVVKIKYRELKKC